MLQQTPRLVIIVIIIIRNYIPDGLAAVNDIHTYCSLYHDEANMNWTLNAKSRASSWRKPERQVDTASLLTLKLFASLLHGEVSYTSMYRAPDLEQVANIYLCNFPDCVYRIYLQRQLGGHIRRGHHRIVVTLTVVTCVRVHQYGTFELCSHPKDRKLPTA